VTDHPCPGTPRRNPDRDLRGDERYDRTSAYHVDVVRFVPMDELQVLDEIIRLLDADDDATVNTSMRLPAALRDAAALAVQHLGVAASTTSLTAAALRRALETAVAEATLEAHFEQHPRARPSLAEVALALAAQDGSLLADRPDLLERAATQVLASHPDADADDVLLWAEAQLAMPA
jgi:hypothetical protein